MQDYYLDSTYGLQEKHGYLLGTFAGAYVWNLLGLGDKFLETGQWAVPGLAWAGVKKDMWNSGDVVLRRNASKLSMNHGASLGEKIGLKFRGATPAGMFSMGAARALSAVNTGATITSPGWYAARVGMSAVEAAEAGGMAAAGGAIMGGLAIGLPWFGGMAILNNAAKAMRKTTYVGTGSRSFVDNGETYTSRQRAVRAIAESHLQARSAIGNEAQLFHHSGG